jgi:hypothetical protein
MAQFFTINEPALPPVQAYAVGGSAEASPTSMYLENMDFRNFEKQINEVGAKAFLDSQGWPKGLQNSFLKSTRKIPIRFFICDNSGSMIANDGHKQVGGKLVTCSRWSELSESLKFHVELSTHSNCPSEFRLLNNAPPILVHKDDGHSQMTALLDESPSGATPLCRHVREVIQQIKSIEHKLRETNQRACIVILTDGDSSDGNLIYEMKPLEKLPVWVVVRLCTDEKNIVDFWNNIDQNLELDMDVLDDISGEAEEVYGVNPGFTYGQPLHHLREFGCTIKEFDLLDESALTDESMRGLCHCILGGNLSEYRDSLGDFSSFRSLIEKKLQSEGKVWDPITKKMQPWIKLSELARNKNYNNTSGCSIS